jgi:hypothetical protein
LPAKVYLHELDKFVERQWVGGWCRNYRSADGAERVFRGLEPLLKERMAGWLAGKHQTTVGEALSRYGREQGIAAGKHRLVMPSALRG